MSATKISKLLRTSLTGVVLFVTVCMLLFVTQARAETAKCLMFGHIAETREPVEVGDLPGHVFNIGAFKGLAVFESGEVATVRGVYSHDAFAEAIPSEQIKIGSDTRGYVILTFEDGSTQVLKGKFKNTFLGKGKGYLNEGEFTYVRGSGRFAGIRGSGSIKGKFFGAPGAYWDLQGTYTLP